MPLAIIILIIVLCAIVLRQIIQAPIPIWIIMMLGAISVLLFNQITLKAALHSIELEVIFYLFGVFLIAQAAEESGYLAYITDKIFYYTRTGKQALRLIVGVLGLSAAFLMNDTIAIIGTPLILQLCKSQKNLIKPLLLALAFSITIGSVISPIGNPQNLLITIKGEITSPFLNFIQCLMIPSLLNLIIIYIIISFIYKDKLNEPITKPIFPPISNTRMFIFVRISLSMMALFVLMKIAIESFYSVHIKFSFIALLSALPLVFSNQKWILIKRLDWGTLIFFASTFVLMQSVWDSGFFQSNISHLKISLSQTQTILMISIILSQFISNVPLVAMYLPLLMQSPYSQSSLFALAAGSTIAGNLSILGAASNIIIIQNCEKRGIKGFGFFEFIKIGAPLTLINFLIYTYFIQPSP